MTVGRREVRIYVCFDDTDILDCGRGTGKLVRWFEDELPEGCTMWGVVRQQLLVDPVIPYTSHNSSACAVIEAPDASFAEELASLAGTHVEKHMFDGSDPGVCVVAEGDGTLAPLIAFGRLAATSVTTQAAAMEAARGVHLSGHGGTNGGIIGAAAGVGLTAGGWAGRFIEYGGLRDFADPAIVADLEAAGLVVLPIDRNVGVPKPTDTVDTSGWLRPRLWGGQPALPVLWAGEGAWRCVVTRPGEEG
jgi:hypothetical protein